MIALDDFKTLKIAKIKCLQSFLFFIRFFYKINHNRKFIVNDHHVIICDALEKVLRGETKRLIINVSPRYGKTEIAVKNFIAYGLALNPSAKFIHLTYAAKLALDNSEEAKDIITREIYQRMFPVAIKRDSKAKDKWYTTSGGGVYAAAAGGQVTGFGAGRVDEEEIIDPGTLDEFIGSAMIKEEFGGAIIIDDPIKPDDAFSDVKRNRVNERFENTIRNRVNSRNTPIIVIGQRVHEEDLCGYLMKTEPGEWTVLKLPCLKDDGTALWEMKHTVDELLHLNSISSYVFESQYQQDPKPIRRGGEAYKKFTKERNVITNKVIDGLPELYDPDLPLQCTFDFNVIPYMTCLIHQTKKTGNLKRDIQIDEITLKHPRNRTKDVCTELIRKYGVVHKSTLRVYGDPSGVSEDTRTEQGENDFTIILKILRTVFKVELFKLEKAPAVAMRISFVDAVFGINYADLEFFIGSNCITTIADYQFGKEDSDGTKLKEVVTDPITKQKYQKYHHCTDANDYFYCRAFNAEYAKYLSPEGTGKIISGKPISKNSY
jgi:hypothetical protein